MSARPDPDSLVNEADREALVRAKWAAVWIGLVLPLALIAAATALLVAWIPRMPDPAATHWGFSGGPDGFGSPWTYVWLNAGLGFGLVLLMRAFVAYGGRSAAMLLWSPFQRFLVAFSAGFAVFMAMVNVGSAAVQLDLERAADAPGIGGLVLLGFGVWIVATALAWFAQPDVRVGRAEGAAARPFEPSGEPGAELPVWLGEVRPSRPFLWVMGVVIALLATGTVLVIALDPHPAAAWIMGGCFALVLAAMLTSLWYRVRIDADGLEACSFMGWPVFRVPASEIERVEAAQIAPLAEFGGWGMRWAPDRFGLVMRTGEGIVVTRGNGRIFAVTVDDAETGASILAAAAGAARAEQRGEQ